MPHVGEDDEHLLTRFRRFIEDLVRDKERTHNVRVWELGREVFAAAPPLTHEFTPCGPQPLTEKPWIVGEMGGKQYEWFDKTLVRNAKDDDTGRSWGLTE